MKKSIIALMIVVFAICILGATGPSQSPDGQFMGYVLKSVYYNNSSTPSGWEPRANATVTIVIRNQNGVVLQTRTTITGVDGLYFFSGLYINPNLNYTATLSCSECSGQVHTIQIQAQNNVNFYVDREF
jgi:hypothetical protein